MINYPSRQAIPREERGLCREPRRPLPHPPSPSAQEVPLRLPGRRGAPLGEDPAGGQVREARRRRRLPAHQHRDSSVRGREPHLRRGQCRLLRRLLGFELGQCRTVDQVSLKLKFKLFKVTLCFSSHPFSLKSVVITVRSNYYHHSDNSTCSRTPAPLPSPSTD